MDQGWVGYIKLRKNGSKLSKENSGLDWIYQNKEGWINLGRICQVESGWIWVGSDISS